MSARRRSRRVAVVTGTRAEYGLLRSSIEAISGRKGLSLQLVVTGMHLLRKFGRTVSEIEHDGWRIDARVKMQRGNDDPLDQAQALARGVAGIARFLESAKSDIVLVLGDRIEAMAGALAGVTTGCIVAHLHGGDLATGDFDDSFRHAITKLAHLHLPATPSAAARIVRMGESKHRVVCVGAPGLDRLATIKRETRRAERQGGGALVLHHPIGRSAAAERQTMERVLRAVAKAGLKRTIIYPSSDRGHEGIIAAIEPHQRHATLGDVCVHPSLDHDIFLRQLIRADVLIGNSSSGIIEAAFAGTPVVNIGPRQDGRERDAGAVIDAADAPHDIALAIRQALRLGPIRLRRSVYGTGQAAVKVADALWGIPIDPTFRRKRNSY